MTIRLRIGSALLFPLACCACSTAPRIEVPAKPVTVTVTHYVPIPAQLVQPCAKPQGKIVTNGDLLNIYLTTDAALSACAAQMDAIRALKP
jgi:hypothetical protein